MGKRILKGLVVFASMMLMVACAAKGPNQPLPAFSPAKIDAADYTSKIDNFIVVLDASSSMNDACKGTPKYTLATELISRMNQTVPELGQSAGLRSFGLNKSMSTQLQYGMTTYSTADFGAALKKITNINGFTPMAKALDAVAMDLDQAKGKSALIIVSDGLQNAGNAIASAQALKDKFGSSLCIYPVLVGNADSGMTLMKKIADIGGCGSFSKAEALVSSAGMAAFVKDVFLTHKAAPKDSDNDGVIDDNDLCPDTPAGVVVDQNGCPLDTDQDGVYDYMDKCPGTPMGAQVNAQGCWILGSLLFDFNKADIKPEGFGELNGVAAILQKNPGMTIVLQGHTDNIGSAAYNQKLSVKRANAAKDYLVNKGISAGRISCEGYGFSQPVATNTTEFGRSLNRRVAIKPEM
ncbi:OmpA-OmpF porin, OOP family [Desulfocicer vacuolatum DSM 3385]|uniref:OmpA-OmpF porin, OOP family n=1 Tax=Desulfocicer vacuolatum DSM 3385 TaxID=1121400 RepID=A0A1W2E1B9_9BACT|nr:OmpA family protein [Desulfocicer vacuolatum]SMD03580.1 OmpA-OmpF porin, OOP family [Desulfocicer vacuolatum DSM 3385]